jgi:predicted NBD/HSP70 family sugar kinase
MPRTASIAIAVIGIDIGNNSFHVVGLDQKGAIVLRQNGKSLTEQNTSVEPSASASPW